MIAPGALLQNRYLVEEQIGQGGMGAVFVATDQRFGSRVALKETFFADPNLRKAFEREARLLNRLRHHALPRVSDHFTEEEGQFLVMEFIPGDDLSVMLKTRGAAFPVADVLAWADQLLDALDYLHTQEPSVIHRDIKPQNLKLTARNQIVLLDFGLAKGTPLQTRVTTSGSVLGYSLNYAPLEQMQGAGTDPRSDLYSLGATLHHLVTGETPHDALTRATAVLNGDEDPLRPASEINAQVPAAVAAVLTRAMSQSAARRFATAAEMRDALREAARELPTATAANVATHAATTRPSTHLSEQETRLMHEAGAAHAKRTSVDDQPDARTALVTPRTEHDATPAAHATADEAAAASVLTNVRDGRAREGDSVVTSVRAPRAGRNTRRAVGVGAAAVAAVLVAAGLYAFTRNAEHRSNARQPVTPTPSTNQSAAQPSATAETQQQQQTAAAPTPTAEAPSPTPAAAQQQPQAATRRAGNTAATRRAANANRGGGVNVVVSPEVPEQPFTTEQLRQLREAQSLSNRNFGPSAEELREIMRRADESRRRAVQQRRENQRLRRRQQAPAPLPPPQP